MAAGGPVLPLPRPEGCDVQGGPQRADGLNLARQAQSRTRPSATQAHTHLHTCVHAYTHKHTHTHTLTHTLRHAHTHAHRSQTNPAYLAGNQSPRTTINGSKQPALGQHGHCLLGRCHFAPLGVPFTHLRPPPRVPLHACTPRGMLHPPRSPTRMLHVVHCMLHGVRCMLQCSVGRALSR